MTGLRLVAQRYFLSNGASCFFVFAGQSFVHAIGKEARIGLELIEHRIDRSRAVTEVTFYTEDHPGLFSQLAGALALSGANIVDAKIFTMTNGLALDVFSVQDATVGGPFDNHDKLARLAVLTRQILTGETRPLQELATRKSALPSRTRVFQVPPRVLVENNASDTHTVIEVNGRDRPGLGVQEGGRGGLRASLGHGRVPQLSHRPGGQGQVGRNGLSGGRAGRC